MLYNSVLLYFPSSRKELPAPAAEAEQRASTQSSIESSHHDPPTNSRRRSRISVHGFLTSSAMFKTGGSSAKPHSNAPRKLRKTRSISDMATSGSSISSSENPTPPPARQHSQSVTAADMPRFITVDVAVPRTGDIFGEVMHWNDLPVNSSGSAPESIVVHPFGLGISFDSPSRRPASEYLPAPRLLREVQSFESGLTARQTEPEARRASESLSDATSSDDSQLSRPPSAVRLRASTLSTLESLEVEPEPIPLLAPLPETSMHSRYSTDVFDVLQTYRGLPLLDKLSPDSEETTVIKMSLSADETAAPRDDPRFVIWGEMQSERDISEDLSASQGSLTDLSSSTRSSNASLRKRNTRAAKAASKAAAEIPSLHISPEDSLQKVLIAATIERWIAQLTSDLDYDELLNFFLTYRTYISAVDLCHLLICRFHWALSQHTSTHDEMVRRVVRVRTFVAIRYWLLTFFVVDFLPNRELRLVLANWLNALIRDPILQKYSDGLVSLYLRTVCFSCDSCLSLHYFKNIVKKLKKVVKDCKKAHSRSASKPKLRAPTTKRHVLGEKFAEATRKTGGDDDEDSDVDLDFLPDDGTMSDVPSGLKNDHVNAHLSVPHVGAGLSPTRPDSIPSSSLSILQQTNRAPGPGPDPELPFIQTSATLPIHHNALSRVFVKTIGRLGRWKRVLNSRAATRAPLGVCVDVSAFDLELSVSRDLLTVNGGVEQYLKMIEPQPGAASTPSQGSDRPILSPISSSAPKLPSLKSPHPIPQNSEHEPSIDDPLLSVPDVNPLEEILPAHVPAPDDTSSRSSSSDSLGLPLSPRATSDAMPLIEPTQIILPHDDISSRSSSSDSLGGPSTQSHISPENNDDASTRSSSLGSLGVPLSPRVHPESNSPISVPSTSYPLSQTAGSSHSSSSDSLGVLLSPNAPNASFPGARSPWHFDVVSIDDLDFSDTSSDLHVAGPPGLRKPPQKKLPSQAQVRAQFEFLRRRSESVSSMGIISHESLASARSSVVSEEGSAAGLGGNIQQWQMNALLDSLSNDEETGDVEAALRKLEGELSPLKQQEKASKVDGWVRTIQERMAAGDYSDDHPRFSDDEAEEQSPDEDDFEEERASMSDDHPETGEDGILIDQQQEWAKTPVATHPSHGIPSSPTRAEAKPAPEDAVPLEILQSRLSSLPLSAEQIPYVGSNFGGPDAPKIHRSFILLHRAEALAQHFSMIDRELFMGVKFEELVLDDWMSCEEVNVLDWGQYLKDRARWKAESRWADKTTALAAVRARFNLMTNFTISEIVLTQPNERALVVGKFIRIAWVSFLFILSS